MEESIDEKFLEAMKQYGKIQELYVGVMIINTEQSLSVPNYNRLLTNAKYVISEVREFKGQFPNVASLVKNNLDQVIKECEEIKKTRKIESS